MTHMHRQAIRKLLLASSHDNSTGFTRFQPEHAPLRRCRARLAAATLLQAQAAGGRG